MFRVIFSTGVPASVPVAEASSLEPLFEIDLFHPSHGGRPFSYFLPSVRRSPCTPEPFPSPELCFHSFPGCIGQTKSTWRHGEGLSDDPLAVAEGGNGVHKLTFPPDPILLGIPQDFPSCLFFPLRTSPGRFAYVEPAYFIEGLVL